MDPSSPARPPNAIIGHWGAEMSKSLTKTNCVRKYATPTEAPPRRLEARPTIVTPPLVPEEETWRKPSG